MIFAWSSYNSKEQTKGILIGSDGGLIANKQQDSERSNAHSFSGPLWPVSSQIWKRQSWVLIRPFIFISHLLYYISNQLFNSGSSRCFISSFVFVCFVPNTMIPVVQLTSIPMHSQVMGEWYLSRRCLRGMNNNSGCGMCMSDRTECDSKCEYKGRRRMKASSQTSSI